MTKQEKSIHDFDKWMYEKGFSPATRRTYIEGVRDFFQRGFKKTDQQTVLQYKATLMEAYNHYKKKSPLSSATVNIRVCALNSYSHFMGNEDVNVKLIVIQEKQFASPDSLNLANYNKLLEGLRKDDPLWYLRVRLLATTGMRIAEAVQISFENLRNRSCAVIGKGEKERTIFFSSSFRKDCEQIIKDNSGPVFYKDGMVMTSGHIRYKLHSFRRRYHIRCRLNPHGFRHFFATQYYENDRQHNLRTIQSILGHSSIKTTGHYVLMTYERVSKRISRVIKW